jgi:hypothetical protein
MAQHERRGPGLDLAAENARQQRENERLRMEREILKNQRGPRLRLRMEKRLALPSRRRGAAAAYRSLQSLRRPVSPSQDIGIMVFMILTSQDVLGDALAITRFC